MVRILSFPRSYRTHTPRPQTSGGAEILFFTGVRYERHFDAPRPASTLQPALAKKAPARRRRVVRTPDKQQA
ncbi:MAG: hypothetical protein JWN93_2832 [Hyphomicrobiales bacterium]|jgi:hypothetical protein|nr:hypothetical protein [Hyphomicrobiales bacterium]